MRPDSPPVGLVVGRVGCAGVTVASRAGLREIEVKYRVEDGEALVAALGSAGVRLGEPVRQDDQAYAPASWAYGMSKIGVPFARLRSQAGRVLFTVKVPRANELDCTERESAVEDRAAMHEALLLLGFVPTVRIVKGRRVGDWAGMQVCVDTVDGLGAFIEVECMVDAGETAEVQAAMDRQVRSLGVPLRRVTQTYDSLLRAAG